MTNQAKILTCVVALLPSAAPVIAAQASDYFPPAGSKGGWRKNTSASFVQSLGIDPVKAKEFVDYWAGLRNDQTSIIIKDGWIVAEAGPGQNIRLASNGKAISIALFGVMLKNRGTQNIPADLSLDSKVYDKRWLPQGFPLSDSRKSQITFRHLFRHTSGIQPEGLGGSDRGGDRDLVRYKLGLDPSNQGAAQLYFDPGHPEQAALQYTSVGFEHIPIIVQNLTKGMVSLDANVATGNLGKDYLNQNPLKPIGIGSYTACWQGSGGPNLKPRDYARFAYLLLHDGEWNGNKMVPQGWIEQFRTTCSYPNLYGNTTTKATGYAGQWPQPYSYFGDYDGAKYPQDLFWIGGSGFQVACIVPSLNLIALKGGPTKSHGSSAQLLEKLFAAVKAR